MELPWKALLRQALVATPLRHAAEPVHDALVSLQLEAFTAFTRSAADITVRERTTNVTAIIKTFERPRALRRLLDSLKRWWPALPIIVADDSRVPSEHADVELIRLPFDSGVSAGRKAALERVRTEYTWLLDDDFVLFAGSRLDRALQALAMFPEVDLVSGPVIYLPLLRKRRGNPNGLFPTAATSVLPAGTRRGDLVIRDKVPNFYVARTERLRLVSWTPELKRVDHADFFTRAKGILVSAFYEGFCCLHAQTPFDREYQSFRQDFENDRSILQKRYNLPS